MSQIVDFNAGGGGGGEDKTVITINVGDPATEVSDNSLVLLSAGAAGPSGPITINLPAASEIKKGIILKKMSNYVILTTINPATGDSIEFAGMNEPLVSITPESYQAFVSAGSILSITGISATQSVIENVFNPVETLIFNAANIGTNPVSPPLTYFNDIPRISYRQVSPAPVGIPTVDLNTNKLIAKPVGSYGVWLEYLSFNKPPVNLEMSNLVGTSPSRGGLVTINVLGSGNLSFPNLEVIYAADFFSNGNDDITSLSMPKVKVFSGSSLVTIKCGAVTSLSFDLLELIECPINLKDNASLTSFLLSNVKYIYGKIESTVGNGVLSEFTLGNSLTYFDSDFEFTSCALSEFYVDNILATLVSLDGTSGKNLYGADRAVTITGTSSAPSAAGLANKAILEGRGATVTVNP